MSFATLERLVPTDRIGYRLKTIQGPPGCDLPPEAVEFNQAVTAYLAEPRLPADPLAIEDFGAAFASVFGLLRRRALLHRQRAELLAPKGVIFSAAAEKKKELRLLLEQHKRALIEAVASGYASVGATPPKRVNSKRGSELEQRVDDEAASALRSSIKDLERWGERAANDAHDDRKASERAAELLQNAFQQFTHVVDL